MIFRAFIPPSVRTNQAISRSQIADLEGDVADLSAQLHTANAGDFLRATRGSLHLMCVNQVVSALRQQPQLLKPERPNR